jgi:hypothetical protein
VPAYWAGGQEWRARLAAPLPGRYEAMTVCSDRDNPALHGQKTLVQAEAYQGGHPLLRHGRLRVSANGRHFEFADGTPFYWLGDTQLMGLCRRLAWPDDFQLLAADRVAKGFSVVQLVAGLYMDMPPFDPRGQNEAGYPWEAGFERINPAYFDMADLRIRWLVREGLMPLIYGAWGYYLPLLGLEKMKRHWRYLVARWGAYPVAWSLAGEATMPYYLSKTPDDDARDQLAGWTEVARYVREVDPYHRLVAIHPPNGVPGRDQVSDDSLLDIDLLQTGHGGFVSVPATVSIVSRERERTPAKPVLVGEVNFEGILHSAEAEVQRLTYWSAVLSGAGAFNYGANGVWQVNTRQQPCGASPHGATWGNMPWEEAYRLPGGVQVALAKRLLERFEWWRFEPHPEWTDPVGGPDNVEYPFAAGIPGQVRVIYMYGPIQPWFHKTKVCRLESDVRYHGFYWDPRSGQEYPLGDIQPSEDGSWTLPFQPEMKDWVLVLQRIALTSLT